MQLAPALESAFLGRITPRGHTPTVQLRTSTHESVPLPLVQRYLVAVRSVVALTWIPSPCELEARDPDRLLRTKRADAQIVENVHLPMLWPKVGDTSLDLPDKRGLEQRIGAARGPGDGHNH